MVVKGKNKEPNNKKTLNKVLLTPNFLVRWTPPPQLLFFRRKGKKIKIQ